MRRKTFEVCARCGYSRESHELGNYADAPNIGRTFLVCPTATWKTEVVSVEKKPRKPSSGGRTEG